MKAISAVLASLLCAASPIAAQEESRKMSEVVVSENQYQLGSQAIPTIRDQYESGEYSEFLSEMVSAYDHAKNENELEGLVEIRKESGNYTISQEKLIEGFDVIQNKKNSELLKAVADQENTVFVQKVRSAAAPTSSSEKEALQTLAKFRTMAPGSGSNSNENQLIEIDLENHYKCIHLDTLAAQGKLKHDRKELMMVLEMERMDQMIAASRSFHDKKLKSAIEKSAMTQDDRLAKVYDMSDLTALSKGRIKAQTPIEEKVASIVAVSQAEFADLNRDLLSQTK